jgi:carboxylesterase type B
MTDYLIHFVTNMDPNGQGGRLINWPPYTTESAKLLTFLDGLIPLDITLDNYRADAIALLTEVTLENPL